MTNKTEIKTEGKIKPLVRLKFIRINNKSDVVIIGINYHQSN